MSLWTYSPEDIQILIAGVYPVKGFIDGSFVSVSKDVMPYSTKRAADGSTGRIYNNSADYTITITIMAQSPANDVFTKLWQLDEITQRAKFPILIKDNLGSSVFHSSNTWIKDIPPLEYNSDEVQRQWVLQSSQGSINIGGNEDPSSLLEDLNSIAVGVLPSVEGVL